MDARDETIASVAHMMSARLIFVKVAQDNITRHQPDAK